MTLAAIEALAQKILVHRFVAIEGVQGSGKSFLISEVLKLIPEGVSVPDSLLDDELLDDPWLGQSTYILQDAMKFAFAQEQLAHGRPVLVERFTLSREVYLELAPGRAAPARRLASIAEEHSLLGRAAMYVVVDRPMAALQAIDEARGWRTPIATLGAERNAYLDDEFVARVTQGATVVRYRND